MTTRTLGPGGPRIGAVALGCMGMSEFYDPVGEREAIATIHRALDLGVTLIDTADMYGIGENEKLVGRALRGRRDRAVLTTKTGILRRAGDPTYRAVDGRPQRIGPALDASLARLGVDYVDGYYLHRVDPAVPVEETVGAMQAQVDAGKARRIGLSEAAPATLRRAAAAAPVAMLQSEYSLFTRDVERNGVLATARELGMTFVAYAPLGRGILTGAIRTTAGFGEADLRRRMPRFAHENFDRNLALVDRFAALAAGARCTPAQLAIAWLLSRGDDIVALPGCERVAHLEENAGGAKIAVDPAVLTAIDGLFPPEAVSGGRLGDERFVNR